MSAQLLFVLSIENIELIVVFIKIIQQKQTIIFMILVSQLNFDGKLEKSGNIFDSFIKKCFAMKIKLFYLHITNNL